MEKLCQENRLRESDFTREALLRDDLWTKVDHGRTAEDICARFMKPICSKFSTGMSGMSVPLNLHPTYAGRCRYLGQRRERTKSGQREQRRPLRE